jgi:AraC-like DNA-binding protein
VPSSAATAVSSLRRIPITEARPELGELGRLIAAGARAEGCTDALFPGVRYARYLAPSSFYKDHAVGPVLIVVAQGRKVARWGAGELAFDPSHHLVVTGEGSFEGRVVEASADRPYLGVMVLLPPDVVAKVLLALAGTEPAVAAETLPAFLAPLDQALTDNVVRFLQAVEDPVARAVVAPLALEEIVFRLLRSDAAAVVRSAVGQAHDAIQIQKAMSFMRVHLAEPISVEDVARNVAMSASHFAHRFRAVARVSPKRYLKQLRLERARQLLIGNGTRASEAGASVGYESASHFARDFKQTFGAAPAAYVRRFRSTT